MVCRTWFCFGCWLSVSVEEIFVLLSHHFKPATLLARELYFSTGYLSKKQLVCVQWIQSFSQCCLFAPSPAGLPHCLAEGHFPAEAAGVLPSSSPAKATSHSRAGNVGFSSLKGAWRNWIITIIEKDFQNVVLWQCHISKHGILRLLTAVGSILVLEIQLILVDEFQCFLLKNFRNCNCYVFF